MSLVRNGRVLLYPAEVLLNTDLLRQEIFRMCDIANLAQTVIGGWPNSPGTPPTLVAGLNCTPTGSPAFSITLAPGVIYQYEQYDATAYPADGSGLASDTSDMLYKQGINLGSTQLNSLNPPGSPGNIYYLVQAQLVTTDTESTTRQYYNPSAPQTPITANANDVRTDTVNLTLKSNGSSTPVPDAGHIGLWAVTVPFGATVITTGMISQYAATNFISEPLPVKVSYASLQASTPIFAVDSGGSVNVIVANPTPAFTVQQAGSYIRVQVAHTNNSTATLNVSGLGAVNIVYETATGSVSLAGGEMRANGIYEFSFTGSAWQLLNPSLPTVSDAALQTAAPIFAVDSSGAANTITVSPSPTYPTVITGTRIYVQIANSNTGATTLNVNGQGAVAVQQETNSGLAALAGGELPAGGTFLFSYTGSVWEVLNPYRPLATNAQALAGTDTTHPVTSAGLASSQSIASPGYMKFPGGLIVQWGLTPSIVPNNHSVVTFPIAFPNNMLWAGGTPYVQNGTQASQCCGVYPINSATMDVTNNLPSTTSFPVYWIAIGY
jgi:hypothetical protein